MTELQTARMNVGRWFDAAWNDMVKRGQQNILEVMETEREQVDAYFVSHKLRRWDTMPDEDGWYFFEGSQAGPDDYGDGATVRDVYWIDEDFIEYWESVSDAHHTQLVGTWYGPIPNPFEEPSCH